MNKGEFDSAYDCAFKAFEIVLKCRGMSDTQWNAFVMEFGMRQGFGIMQDSFKEFYKEEE